MRARPRRYLVAIIVAVAVASPLAAQPKRNEARELYQKATRHYELGEYDRAIEEYKRAYEISAAPALLFNLGQVYRLKKEPALALRFYTNYLRLSPDAANRADVEAFIAEMRAAVEAQDKARATEPPTTTPAPPTTTTTETTTAPEPSATTPTPATTAKAAAPRRNWRVELGAAGGVAALGLGATIAGLAVGARANSDAAQLQRDAATRTQTWTPARQALYHDGQSSATAATALDIVGPIVIAGGVVLGVVAWRDRHRARRFALVPSPDGGGVACAF